MAHLCHAEGCPVAVPPRLLMCATHWRLVPAPVKRLVWKHFREGQCDDKRPSFEWCVAADAAVEAVAQKTGRLVKTTFLAAFFPDGPTALAT